MVQPVNKTSSPHASTIYEIKDIPLNNIRGLDIGMLGELIYCKSSAISERVNKELLEPISKWLDDPKWIKRFNTQNKDYNWASYKRKQRQWNKEQRRLLTERMRNYWDEIRRKRALLKNLRKIRQSTTEPSTGRYEFQNEFISPIVSPFSPTEQMKSQTRCEFLHAPCLSESAILPWKAMLICDLKHAKQFRDLKVYYTKNRKSDAAFKLIHLLELEKEGKIALDQEKPFDDIIITPIQTDCKATVTVKDKHGRHYEFNWSELNPDQQNKLINDMTTYKILNRSIYEI